MDQREPSPAFDLLLAALAMILVILVGLVVLRKSHAWPWAQDAAAFAPPSSRSQPTEPITKSRVCIAGHSCLVEDLRCIDAPLVCKNHFWSDFSCAENEPCPPNSVCKSVDQRDLFCDPASRNTLQPVNVEARQPI